MIHRGDFKVRSLNLHGTLNYSSVATVTATSKLSFSLAVSYEFLLQLQFISVTPINIIYYTVSSLILFLSRLSSGYGIHPALFVCLCLFVCLSVILTVVTVEFICVSLLKETQVLN